MMNQIVLRQIADFQMLNGSFNSNLGLFNGKMGIALFFFFYAQSVHCDLYEEFAGELLDDICNNLSTYLPVTFGDGLCGIGWGVEFMKRQGFIEGETDERVDITDVVCPMTFVKAKVAMEELEIGQVLAVTMNDGEPVQNVPRSFKEEGQQVLKLIDNENGTYDLIVKKVEE